MRGWRTVATGRSAALVSFARRSAFRGNVRRILAGPSGSRSEINGLRSPERVSRTARVAATIRITYCGRRLRKCGTGRSSHWLRWRCSSRSYSHGTASTTHSRGTSHGDRCRLARLDRLARERPLVHAAAERGGRARRAEERELRSVTRFRIIDAVGAPARPAQAAEASAVGAGRDVRFAAVAPARCLHPVPSSQGRLYVGGCAMR